MTTTNPRLNVTFDRETALILQTISKEEERSISNVIKHLVLEALELHEDMALSKLAHKRASKKQKLYSHQAAWK